MIKNFLILVETIKGEFITAFTYTGSLNDAVQKGFEKAYQRNVINAEISTLPIANK